MSNLSNPPENAPAIYTHTVRTLITAPIAELQDAQYLLNAIIVGSQEIFKEEFDSAHANVDSALAGLNRLRDACALAERGPSALISIEAAAKRLGVSRRTFYLLIALGDIVTVRFGRNTIRIDPADLARYVESKKIKPSNKERNDREEKHAK